MTQCFLNKVFGLPLAEQQTKRTSTVTLSLLVMVELQKNKESQNKLIHSVY